jgi:hypothetical protein
VHTRDSDDIIIIIIIIIINCNWVVTRWQWLIYKYTVVAKFGSGASHEERSKLIQTQNHKFYQQHGIAQRSVKHARLTLPSGTPVCGLSHTGRSHQCQQRETDACQPSTTPIGSFCGVKEKKTN